MASCTMAAAARMCICVLLDRVVGHATSRRRAGTSRGPDPTNVRDRGIQGESQTRLGGNVSARSILRRCGISMISDQGGHILWRSVGYSRARRSRSALAMTETELTLIAALAII